MAKTETIHLPSFLSISEYAKEKKVSRGTVYNYIGKGIELELVGHHQHGYIDMDKYGDFQFPKPGGGRSTLKTK